MSDWSNSVRGLLRPSRAPRRRGSFRPTLDLLEDRRVMTAGFVQTNLVSDVPGMAAVVDDGFINPWGMVAGPTSDFWISENKGGQSALYDFKGNEGPFAVNIPTASGMGLGTAGTPTGIVFNTSGTGFTVTEGQNSGSSVFLFATLDGTISGWSPTVDHDNAIKEVTNSNAVYTGLAIGTNSHGDTFLYAANPKGAGGIDVYDSNFAPVALQAGAFQDSKLPADARPFNVQNIGGKLYVEYKEGAGGPGKGFVDVYNTDGMLLSRLIRGGALNNPWGITLAPSAFGQFSNDLLVGNFGDGHINAFNPVNGNFVGQLTLANGQPFSEDHLWALSFGNGAAAGAHNTLFFTAGIGNEAHGLFGSLDAVPALPKNLPVLSNINSAIQQNITTVVGPNGDQNPYGTAFVPQGFKAGAGSVLQPGDLLVSNFNSNGGAQGTGTTIVRITPDGQTSTFFQGDPGLGLTTALGVLRNGFVVVGNLPTDMDGNPQQGSLLILDSTGKVVKTLTDPNLLNGPWDLAVNDMGNTAQLFVANVLNGTITRVDLRTPVGGTPAVMGETQIASGYTHRLDSAALVVGPTGLAYDPSRHVLYVAATGDNAIYEVANADTTRHDQGKGTLFIRDDVHLHGPLGLVVAPNGDLIIANGDAVNSDPRHLNTLVEYNARGHFVTQYQLDTGAPGAAFGLALSNVNGTIRFAAVDDNTNSVQMWTYEQNDHSFWW